MSKTAASVLSANLNTQNIPSPNAGMHSQTKGYETKGYDMSDERVYSVAADLPPASAQLAHYDDDISLVDVAVLIVKHKRVLFSVFAGIMLLGTLAMLLIANTYDYKAVLEVGSYRLPEQDGVLGKRQEIESITQVKSKLEKRFISAALLAYNQQHPGDGLPSVKVSAPAESNVVELSIKGDKKNSALYIELLKQISADLIADHNEKLMDVREQVMQSIEKQRIKVGEYAAKLDNAKTNQSVMRKSIGDLQQEKTMLAQQLDRMDRNLEKINKLKAQYNAESTTARDGLTLLLLDNQLIETQKLRDKLESLDVVGLSQKSAIYASKLATAEQAISMNQLMYANAQQVLQRYMGTASTSAITTETNGATSVDPANELATQASAAKDGILRTEPILNIDPTALVVAPHRGAEPASLPISVLLGLLLFLALFVSLMSVFIYEFVQKVKSQTRREFIVEPKAHV